MEGSGAEGESPSFGVAGREGVGRRCGGGGRRRHGGGSLGGHLVPDRPEGWVRPAGELEMEEAVDDFGGEREAVSGEGVQERVRLRGPARGVPGLDGKMPEEGEVGTFRGGGGVWRAARVDVEPRAPPALEQNRRGVGVARPKGVQDDSPGSRGTDLPLGQ